MFQWIVVIYFLGVVVAGTAAQSNTPEISAQCQDLMSSIAAFRQHMKAGMEASYYTTVQRGMMRYVGINLESDEDLRDVFCALIGSNQTTISNLAASSSIFVSEQDAAFAYVALKKYLKQELTHSRECIEYESDLIELFDAINFPNFPIELTEEELKTILTGVATSTLFNIPVFGMFVHAYPYADNITVDYDELVSALIRAKTLRSFVESVYFKPLEDMKNYSDFYGVRMGYLKEQIDYQAEDLYNSSVSSREKLRECKAWYNSTRQFAAALDKYRVLNLTRGGNILHSCTFMADTAVNALQYAKEVYGTETVKDFMSRDLMLQVSLDDEQAVRSLVCSIVGCKSQSELKRYLPRILLYGSGDYFETYRDIMFNVMWLLTHPQPHLSQSAAILHVAEIAKSANFPEFPLRLSEEELQQFASSLAQLQYRSTKKQVQDIVKALKDADAYKQLEMVNWSFHFLAKKLEFMVDNSDSYVKLASAMLQLAVSAENLGLFMLPEY